MDDNSNLRISISCSESSVSSAAAAAAAAAAVEDDVLLLELLLSSVVSNEVRKLVYLLPTLVSDPRAAPVPLPVRIRSLRVSLEREGGEMVGGVVVVVMPSFVMVSECFECLSCPVLPSLRLADLAGKRASPSRQVLGGEVLTLVKLGRAIIPKYTCPARGAPPTYIKIFAR